MEPLTSARTRALPRGAAALCLAALVALLAACADRSPSPSPGPPGPGDFDTSFGGSALGEWINDEFGLPAFRYRGCAAPACTEPPDAFHQLGTGSLTAVAHARGYVELFTARTFYRFANRYADDRRDFAGGFGWIRDGDDAWSTLYDDRPPSASYERIFGMGYVKKIVEHRGLRVEHYVYAPPGDDEVLLEHIVLTNLTSAAKSVRYFDYWDVAWWLVRHSDPVTDTSIFDPATVTTSYDTGRAALVAIAQGPAGDAEVPSLVSDPSPKASFVAYLNEEPERFDTVQDGFLGDGSRTLPQRVRDGELGNSLDASGTLPNQSATLVTQKSWSLAPGERAELDVLYGMAPRGEHEALIDRHRRLPANRLREVASHWAARMPRVELPEQRWIGREMAWSAYYLLSGMLREDFFDTRVINQGSIYQYDWGANAGPRAALRHVLPVIYLDADAARDVIVYYLRAMRPNGLLSYATAGHGGWQPFGFEPSDSGLWLLWAAAEYVFATRDFAFLEERFDFYCEERRGGCGSATALEMLARAYDYQANGVATGPHGLVRLLDSDWDDFLTSFSNEVDSIKTEELGESTMNTALALVAYAKFADLAERGGDASLAATVRAESARLAPALDAQWRGDFFNRAYVYTRDGEPIEVGADNLWLASNGLALLAPGALDEQRATRLVARARTDLLDPSPLGLASQGAPITPRLGTAGFWYSLAGPALEGLAGLPHVPGARELAWEAFQRQTLAQHAAAYPNIWYGAWSGPDMYFTPLDAAPPTSHPGETWCLASILCMQEFPVTNAFSHSEPLIGGIRMAGLTADALGLIVDPAFPFPSFTWESRSFAIEYGPTEASGRVETRGDDVLQMRVRVPGSAASGAAPEGNVTVRVDGRSVPFALDDGLARFDLRVRGGVASTWSVRGE